MQGVERNKFFWGFIGALALIVFVSVCAMVRSWFPAESPLAPVSPKASAPKSLALPQIQPVNLKFSDLVEKQTVNGIVTLSVNAQEDAAVRQVSYTLDGSFIGVSYSKPYTVKLDTASLSDDEHTVEALSYDDKGNLRSKQSITLVVDNSGSITKAADAVVAKVQDDSAPATTAKPGVPQGVALNAEDGYGVAIQWQAVSNVSGYLVYRNGTLLDATTNLKYQDQTVVPGNTYSYSVVAKNSTGSVSDQSVQPVITLASTTLWLDAESPAADEFNTSSSPAELGIKFHPLVDGKITGIRFYKANGSTGTHVGHVWDSNGKQLASANFASESASGWQEVTFSSPVNITAGTTYVASYFAPNGDYAATPGYFDTSGITSQYLAAQANVGEDTNGIFHAGTSGFPTGTQSGTNYWVDVSFVPNTAASGPVPEPADTNHVYPGYPGSDTTGVPVGKRLPKRDRAIKVYTDGSVLRNIEVAGGVDIEANNVTLQNVRVAPTKSQAGAITQETGHSGLTVQDSNVFGDGVNQIQYGILNNGSNLIVQRTNIGTVSHGIKSNTNTFVQDSYIHDLTYFDGDHNDDFVSTGGDNITLLHNTLNNPLAQTATIELYCGSSPFTNVSASNNLLMGGRYAVYWPCDGSSNVKFQSNVLSRSVWPMGGANGTVAGYNKSQVGAAWENNVWYEDKTPITP